MKNKSDAGVMLKEAGILFAITLIAGLLLGFVYELTKNPIEEQRERAVQEACRAVFEEASGFESIDYVPSLVLQDELAEKGVAVGNVYAAKDADGMLLGYVIESTSKEGYGGNIVLYVGVTMSGMVNDVSILSISETAGLGMRAEEVLVPQFHQKTAESFVYTKSGAKADNEIDVITSATITTKAFTTAVNGALSVARDLGVQVGGSLGSGKLSNIEFMSAVTNRGDSHE